MKENSIRIFEEYSVPRAVAAMSLPSMMGMLINIVYNLADTFFVGQTGDGNQVAAVSVSMPLFLFFLAIGNLFGIGGCAFISRSLGEGRNDRVKTISSFCIYTAIAVGVVVGILFLTLTKPLLFLVGASDNTIEYACDYLRWVAIGAPFVVISITVGNLVRGEGAAKTSMVGSVLGQVVNIILDPVFILGKGDKMLGLTLPFGFDLGVKGAAIATVIGNICSVIYFLIYFLRGKSILSITPGRYSVKNSVARGVISVGLPASLNNLLMSISNIFVNTVLVSYGDDAVAAMGIAMKANLLVVMLQIGLGQGIQPLVGYCYGAKNYTRMKKCMSFGMVCNIIIGTCVMVFYLIFKENVIGLFIDNKAVVDLGVKMLAAIMSSGPIIGILFVLNFSFQGMGKGSQTLILSISRQGFVFIPLLFILNKTVGLEGIIWSQPIADFCCVILAIIMFCVIMKGIKKKELGNA